MDAATEGHIQQAQRPAEKRDPRRFKPGEVSIDVPADVLDPAVRLGQMRKQRTNEALERKLDELVPMERQGDYWVCKTICTSCRAEIFVRSEEKPDLRARAVLAGAIRRARGSIVCDGCALTLEAEEERAEQAQRTQARVSESKLDKAMQGFEFGQMKAVEGRDVVIAAARDWASEEFPDPRGLCLVGHKGVGKTRLAATATWQRLRRWPVTWVSFPILLAELGAAFNDSARQRAIAVLTGKGALVLDDIARDDVKVSDWAKNQLFAAIDKRIQAGAPLLITTNLTSTPDGGGPMAAIGERLGDSVVSRLAGYCRVLELPGQDMRLEFDFEGKPKEERK